MGKKIHSLDEVVRTIEALTKRTGYPPTFGEIGAELKMSKSHVKFYVDKGVECGVLAQQPRRPRTLRVLV